jgi:hypothetical protein
MSGLQPGPGGIERFAGLLGVIAELGGRRGVADGQDGEEPLGGRGRTVRTWRTALHSSGRQNDYACDS